jgi:hypothetical protein
MGTAPANPPLASRQSVIRKLRVYGAWISGTVGFIKTLLSIPETLRQAEGYFPIIGNFLLNTVEFAILWIAAVVVVALIVPVFTKNEGMQFLYPLILGTLFSIHLFFTYGFAGALPGIWIDISSIFRVHLP